MNRSRHATLALFVLALGGAIAAAASMTAEGHPTGAGVDINITEYPTSACNGQHITGFRYTLSNFRVAGTTSVPASSVTVATTYMEPPASGSRSVAVGHQLTVADQRLITWSEPATFATRWTTGRGWEHFGYTIVHPSGKPSANLVGEWLAMDATGNLRKACDATNIDVTVSAANGTASAASASAGDHEDGGFERTVWISRPELDGEDGAAVNIRASYARCQQHLEIERLRPGLPECGDEPTPIVGLLESARPGDTLEGRIAYEDEPYVVIIVDVTQGKRPLRQMFLGLATEGD